MLPELMEMRSALTPCFSKAPISFAIHTPAKIGLTAAYAMVTLGGIWAGAARDNANKKTATNKAAIRRASPLRPGANHTRPPFANRLMSGTPEVQRLYQLKIKWASHVPKRRHDCLRRL